jgi:GGDEF domain-containing protein
MELNRILNQQLFLYLLDMEVKRARRYQNFFCILTLKINRLSSGNSGTDFENCYQQLTKCVKEEFRESDILGSVGENSLVALLPYADRSAGCRAKFHFESCLKYYDFKKEGYEVMVDKICFPGDGTDTSDLVKKLLGSEAR